MGKNTSGFVALGWWQLPPQPSLRGATSWGSRTFGRPMPPKAVAAFARARWQPRLVGGANPDQLLCNSDTLNVASTHQDVSSRMMSMQQLHTISMALSNRICCVMWYCDVIFLFWVAPQSYKQRALAAPWKALDESCTGPDVVARNLAQTATERQSAALQGFYFGWFYDVLITPRSRAWTCLDQETMLLFFFCWVYSNRSCIWGRPWGELFWFCAVFVVCLRCHRFLLDKSVWWCFGIKWPSLALPLNHFFLLRW